MSRTRHISIRHGHVAAKLYSKSRFSFRENKTGKTSNSNLTKEKPNEKKTENAYFQAKALSVIKGSSFNLNFV